MPGGSYTIYEQCLKDELEANAAEDQSAFMYACNRLNLAR
jgi:hypothetical protein